MSLMSSRVMLLARACDPGSDPNSAACEKPTSNFLTTGVPGIVVGVLVFIAACVCCYLLYRNRKRDNKEVQADRMWHDIHS